MHFRCSFLIQKLGSHPKFPYFHLHHMVGFLRLQWTSDGGEREQHWCLSSSLLIQQNRICSHQQRIRSLQSSNSIRFLHFEYFRHLLRCILTSALSICRVFQVFVLCLPMFSLVFCSGTERTAHLLERKLPMMSLPSTDKPPL
jgi:hypothetical protein